MKTFKVTVVEFQTGNKLSFNCDLIDHDGTGDVRFYRYTHPTDRSKVALEHKFESHLGAILSVDII